MADAGGIALAELAVCLDLSLRGDGEARVARVAALDRAGPDCLSFLGDARYRRHLAATRAGAVILREPDAEAAPASVPLLIGANPYLAFARAARLLHPDPPVSGGIHPSAVVDPEARIDPSAWIGPLSVVESGAIVGPRVFVGPGCILGADVEVGADSRLVARVTLCTGTRVGQRALLHPGAVIGREGFGFARDGERWIRIPQVGRAILGDDVEIGAHTSVDRGALGDTLIGRGVKLDSHIHVGHNVEIGEHTAMAANCGISGSVRIGRHCTVGGASAFAGHIEVGDRVHFTGMAMVTGSVAEPGLYSSGIPAMPNRDWRRNAVRFKQLDQLVRRLKRLEARIDTNETLGQGDI